MRWVILAISIAAVLLGGLWLAQGLGLVRIEPIACVANCEALEGPSPLWAAIGILVLGAGAFGVFRSWPRRRSSQ